MKTYRIKDRARVARILSAESYDEVLELRRRAYAASGKLAPVDSFTEATASGDAKIWGIYLEGALAASFVIRVPASDAVLESVNGGLGFYPSDLPARTRSIEISKLCIDPAQRGTDLIKMVFEEVHRELVLSRRRSILICSEERLRAKYRLIGFRGTGYRFRKNDGPSGELEVMVSTQKRLGIYGFHVGPLRWNWYLADVTQSMLRRGEVRPNLATLAVWTVYSAFAPLAILIENFLFSRRKSWRTLSTAR